MKKVISLFMCLLLFASTSGVAYAQHFCGDFEMMATLTLGGEELSCGMAEAHDDSCDTEDAEDHNCCDNQYTKITTDENFNASQDTFQVSVNFVTAFVSVFVLQAEIATTSKIAAFSEYNPPPIIKDIPVLYETFLI
ncbi:MAG: hypothetical protein CMC70_01695 [Flavobacteriaceae bacterium]|nr:hypothetical protein [Flavobacteriaceae bacterium]